MKLPVKKYAFTAILSVISTLHLLAQNVVDSDLSNTAGTNKNFRAGWWLFAVIILVILGFVVSYNRRRRDRKI